MGRALDTIADTEEIPSALRLQTLHAIQKIITNEIDLSHAGAVIEPILLFITKPKENDLITKVPSLINWLALMPEEDKKDIINIMQLILSGDEWDLNLFSKTNKIESLKSEKELLQYCYYQASGIAEIANKIIFRQIDNYALLDEKKMSELANQGGLAVQLINIIRDIPADLR